MRAVGSPSAMCRWTLFTDGRGRAVGPDARHGLRPQRANEGAGARSSI